MIDDHPIRLDVRSPEHFDRVQLLLRLAIMIALAWVGLSAGPFSVLLYLLLPIVAAIAVSSEGRDGYVRDFAPPTWRTLRWLLELSAYMMLLTDRFPTVDGDAVRADIRITARPTVASALGRLVTSIPSAIVLCVLGCVGWLLCAVAVVTVLLAERVPSSILAVQRGVLRWQARLLGYHASLVDEYPPFALDTHGDPASKMQSPGPWQTTH